ncbi:MAG: sugar ABC transporter ATP-binding protein [Spirochaetes bacterium]|nr:MAG: sugar ABC transporter ATP-binding protein [Spirochaetota bacterium]
MNKEPIVEVKNIGMSFGATRALDDVDFNFYPGELLALVGANGAGKSTLIKIICGYHSGYEGQIIIDNKEVDLNSPKEAYDYGIQTVHQIINQGVIQTMTVAENLALEEMLSPDQPILYNYPAIRKRALEIASLMDLDYLDMDAPVFSIPQSDRQMISIARALASNPKLLILDEPTSSISEKEAERLFSTLLKLRDSGVSIVYVSHRLHEITRLADRVGVLRDGKVAGELVVPFSVQNIVHAMVGDIEQEPVKKEDVKVNKNVVKLELKDLVVQEGKPGLNLKIYEGEVLGLTGLIGAGKSELAAVLFGDVKPISGEMYINGKLYEPENIGAAIKKGIFMVPEDRNNNAVFPDFSIRQNINMPFLDMFTNKAFVLNTRKERKEAKRMVKAMTVKCESEDSPILSLSGGNQQKVIVARWLMTQSNLVILDEPFQGVDVKSRSEIGQYLRKNIGKSTALVIATDLDEVIDISDRVIVFNHGVMVGEQEAGEIDKEKLIHLTSQTLEEILEPGLVGNVTKGVV